MTDIANTLVIGIGSPFGADQLGWQIVEQLENRRATLFNNNIQLEACDRPGTLLLEYFRKTDTAIIIDAVEGGLAGNIRIVDKAQLIGTQALQSSHQLGVAETIALGEQLKLLPDKLVLIGIETGTAREPYRPTSADLETITSTVAATILEMMHMSESSQH